MLGSWCVDFGGEAVAADRLIVLADHPTLCGKHDRAIVVKAAENASCLDPSTPIIVDIAFTTLETGEAG